MWFATNIGYGFFLGTYSKKFINLNNKLKLEKSPFRLFALIPEIYNKIDLTKDAIRSLVNVYIGFEPKYRSFEDIQMLSAMLKDYVTTSGIIVYTNANFFTGVDVQPYYLLFQNVPENNLEGLLENEDSLLLLYDNIEVL